MQLKLRNGSVLTFEPAAILETPQALAFLAQCAEGVVPHISGLSLRNGVSGKYVLHCVNAPAVIQHEDVFGTVAEEYHLYGVRHRTNGPAVWEKNLYQQYWLHGSKVSENQTERYRSELARIANEAGGA